MVEQIHAEFREAVTRTKSDLQKRIASKPNEPVLEATFNRFGNSKSAAKQMAIVAASKSVVDSVSLQRSLDRYVATIFPKGVVSAVQLMEICKKYDLVLGDSDQFVGAIPTKCAQTIETFLKTFMDKYEYLTESKVIDIYQGKGRYSSRYGGTLAVVANREEFSSSCKECNNILYTQEEINLDPMRYKTAVKDPIVGAFFKVGGSDNVFFGIVEMWGPEAELEEFRPAPKVLDAQIN